MDFKSEFKPHQLEQFERLSCPAAVKRRAQAGFTKPIINFGVLERVDGLSDTSHQRRIENRTGPQKALDRLGAMDILAEAMERLRARPVTSAASYRHAMAHADWVAGILYVSVPKTATVADPGALGVIYVAFSRIRDILGEGIELAVFFKVHGAAPIVEEGAEPRRLGRPIGVHGGFIPDVSELAAQLRREKRAKNARESRAEAKKSTKPAPPPAPKPKKVREQLAEKSEKEAIEAAKPPPKRGRPFKIRDENVEVPEQKAAPEPIKPEDEAKAGTVGKAVDWDKWKDIDV